MLLFPDTNFFLQCRVPAELPWTDITSDQEIRLVASRTVQGEIDRFKGDGKGRRSDRARKVSSWFASVIDKGMPTILRDRSPKVTLELPPRIRPGHPFPPGLDLTRPDDRIVGEVLAFQDAETAEAVLLTDDTYMKQTARDEGLRFVAIPGSWRLDPEPDAKDRTIAELQKRVTLLERSSPIIEIASSIPGDIAPMLQRVRYGSLPEDVVEELVDALRSISPEKTDFPREADPGYVSKTGLSGLNLVRLAGLEWTEPSAVAISDYKKRYVAWLKAVRVHFGRLHRVLPNARRQVNITWSLENVGTLPAEGLIIDIKASGGVALLDPALPLKGTSPDLPEPPAPPVWETSRTALGMLSHFDAAFRTAPSRHVLPLDFAAIRRHSGHPEPVRDPYAFYRRGRPAQALSRQWAFECAEFRHGREPKIFETTAVTVGSTDSGVVCFRASARNLPIPAETLLPIHIVSSTGKTEDEARALVDMVKRAEALRRKHRAAYGFDLFT